MKKTLLLFFLMTFTLGFAQTAAPTAPPRNTWDVISVFSGAYTDVGSDFYPNWGQSTTYEQVALGGDTALHYSNLNYQGVQFNTAINAASMTKLHIDYWTPSMTTFQVYLIAGGENAVNLTPTLSGWNSVDIDLATGYPGRTLNNIIQFKFQSVPFGGTQVYIDNLYFWRPATLLPPTLGTFTVASQSVGAPDFTLTPPTSTNTSPFTYTSSNTSVATIVNGDQIHIVGGGSSTITASQVSDGSYGPSSTTATFTASYPAPGPSPTPPVRNPGTVVSMYTGNPPAYADPVGFNMIRASWTGGTSSDFNFPNGTNTCIKLDNLGYFGYVTSTEPVRFSVVGMSKLHVDIYVNAPLANLFVFLLSNGDQIYNTGPLAAGWNSLDINLSNYPGADLSSIYGFKFEQNVGPAVQMYLDNIYFYVAGSDPGITNFTVPAAVFGDADFTITPPTSSSAGAFTYTSSNTSVATIVNGNQIHLVGVGSSTITANQAADGIYDSGAITASLVVSAPPLATAAPTPPARNTWDVVSLYSNAYTNVASASWQGASSLTDEVLEGNDTKKMSNFIVELINFAATDVSQMTMLHMDIYTPDCPGFNIWLLNNGDRNAQIFPAVNGWRSIDIPLTTYSNAGLIMTGISLLKFESLSGPGKTVYVDNIYFYRPATLFPATVGTFTVPAKNLGDADFTLTPPTSNNTSPFTYTSSNTSVATIVNGDQVHIVSGGTSTITASQVQDGTYGPTSTTASLVVSFPAPGASPVPPARDPSRVVSMFTGTPSVYANPVGYSMVRAPWTNGATTLTEIPNGTNTCLRVDNLGYLGYVTSTEPTRFSAVGMTNLHLDVYVNAPFANLFFFLLTDGDQRRDITNLVAGWNSINIDLTEFSGANLANIYGFKFEQNQPGALQIYVDNMYFSNDTYYADTDGDGYGDLAAPILASTQPVGYVTNSTDCDDTNIAIYRNGDFYVDADNDGFNNGGPQSTLCYGATTPSGYTANNIGTDCNDDNAEINPNHVEVLANGIDDNCDGTIDEVAPTSSIQPSQCGSTLSSLSTAIYANVVSGALGYRFEVTNGVTVRTFDAVVNNFNLQNLAGGSNYATTYSIRVAVKTAPGFWRAYGSACTVTTPAIAATTKISFPACGITLSNMATTIYCDAVPSATGYRFRATDGVTTTTFDATVNRFNLTNVNAAFATTYTIDVQLKFGTTWETTWGAVCTYTTPATPGTSNVSAAQCGVNITNLWATIYASQISVATGYRFEVTKSGGGTVFYDTPNSRFSLRNITVPGFTATNSSYSIRVAILYNSVYQAFGSACTITTTGASRITNTPLEVFEVSAYPNPFANNFKLEVNTSSEENVSVKVYDMLGRAIEMKQGNLSDMTSLEMGDQLTSGVYNIIVTQGEHVKTLRMIKR